MAVPTTVFTGVRPWGAEPVDLVVAGGDRLTLAHAA